MKKLLVILLLLAMCGCASASGTAATSASSASTEEAIEVDFDKVYAETVAHLEGGIPIAVEICGITNTVWYDAIHEKKYSVYNEWVAPNGNPVGFNTAIANFHASDLFISTKETLLEREETLKENFRILKNAPEEYKDSFEYLLEAYTVSSAVTEAAISPSGTYNDYSTNYNRLVEEFNKAMQKAAVFKP